MERGPTCARMISAPASARATAIAWPIPRVPPVTRAIWPLRENSSVTGGAMVSTVRVVLVVRKVLARVQNSNPQWCEENSITSGLGKALFTPRQSEVRKVGCVGENHGAQTLPHVWQLGTASETRPHLTYFARCCSVGICGPAISNAEGGNFPQCYSCAMGKYAPDIWARSGGAMT